MAGYLSKIAVRAGEMKQGGQKTGFISSALRAANDDANIIQKEPAVAVGQAFEHPQPIPSPRGQFLNTSPENGIAVHDFSINPAKVEVQNTHSSYLYSLASRSNVEGISDEKKQNNKMTAVDDFTILSSERVSREIKKAANENEEIQTIKAAVQPAEIDSGKKSISQKDFMEVQDFLGERKTSENLQKKSNVNRPKHIEPQVKGGSSSLKISEKESVRGFNPVENSVITQQPGRKNTGQKVVIGKITVEVIPAQSAPVKMPQSASRRPLNTANDKSSPIHKLSFGLGQL